jgi:hypothetical protein
MYLMKPQNFTVPLRLSILQSSLNEVTGGQAGEFFNEPTDHGGVFTGCHSAADPVSVLPASLCGVYRAYRLGRLRMRGNADRCGRRLRDRAVDSARVV